LQIPSPSGFGKSRVENDGFSHELDHVVRSVFGKLKLGKIPMTLGKASMNGVDEQKTDGVDTKVNMIATTGDLP
jgi:hypothetical protein